MTDESKICPICGEGKLLPQKGKNSHVYKGHHVELDIYSSLCDSCGSEQSDATQLRANKRAVLAFKKRIDGLLTGSELRALRKKLGLNQAEAAKVFGGGPVAFSKYESDDVAQSEAMDRLLRMAAELPAAYELLVRQAGMEHIIAGQRWENVKTWNAKAERPVGGQRPRPRVISSSKLGENQDARYAA